MDDIFDKLINFLKRVAGAGAHAIHRAALTTASAGSRASTLLITIAVLGACGFVLWHHPPFLTLDRGEMAVRTNRLSGNVSQIMDGSFIALPWIYEVRRFTTRDQVYRTEQSASATGDSPFQSVEGMSIGVDLTIRYAIDPKKLPLCPRICPTTSRRWHSPEIPDLNQCRLRGLFEHRLKLIRRPVADTRV